MKLPFNRKVVQFADGKYAIRKWTPLGFRYKSLISRHWYGKRHENFGNCTNVHIAVLERNFLYAYEIVIPDSELIALFTASKLNGTTSSARSR